MLNLTVVEIVVDTDQEDGSVELCLEAEGAKGLLSAKLYFADRESADRFVAEMATEGPAPTS